MPSQAMTRPALQRNKPMDSRAKGVSSSKDAKNRKFKGKVKKFLKKHSGATPANKKGNQGYNAKLDESLGMRKGEESGKKQSMKSRRDESKGMAKKVSKKRAYGAVKTMDKKK